MLGLNMMNSGVLNGLTDRLKIRKGMNEMVLTQISSLSSRKNSNKNELPKIRQLIKRSYEDPYKEQRFIEKDVNHYKQLKYKKRSVLKGDDN